MWRVDVDESVLSRGEGMGWVSVVSREGDIVRGGLAFLPVSGVEVERMVKGGAWC